MGRCDGKCTEANEPKEKEGEKGKGKTHWRRTAERKKTGSGEGHAAKERENMKEGQHYREKWLSFACDSQASNKEVKKFSIE